MDLMFLHRIVVYEDGLGREQDQIRPAHLLWQILVDVVARDIIVAAAASVLLDVAHILIAIPFLADVLMRMAAAARDEDVLPEGPSNDEDEVEHHVEIIARDAAILGALDISAQIGRASCRERGCK